MTNKLFSRLSLGRKHTTRIPRRRLNSRPESVSIDGERPGSDYADRRQQFRRNQTFTGSTSTSISSAVENDAGLVSPRAATHHLRRKQRSLGLRLLGVFVLAAVVLLLLYELVADVRVSYYGQIADATDAHRVRAYEDKIQDYLAKRPLERLRPLLNLEGLTLYLQDNGASEVREITSLNAAELGGAQIVLKLREPVVAWTIGGNKQYVDRYGYIFGENHYSEPAVTVVDESGITSSSDIKTIASSRFLQFIGLGVGYAATEGLSVKRVILPPDTTRQVQFALNDKSQTRIKLSIDRPVGEQVEDAARAYRYLVGKGVSAKYIDVRVSGRAYYI